MSDDTPVSGCPRHPIADRTCIDARCTATWKVEGAPTADEQLARWVAGEPTCPNEDHECCPDFSCCRPALLWPENKRKKYAASTQEEREKMLLGALGGLMEDAGVNAYITRGNPTDRE
ncbi:MAG: hypothetical protein ACHREM_00625 [Polyangiales bacterium]